MSVSGGYGPACFFPAGSWMKGARFHFSPGGEQIALASAGGALDIPDLRNPRLSWRMQMARLFRARRIRSGLMRIAWLMLQDPEIEFSVMRGLSKELKGDLDTGQRQLLLADILSVAAGRVSGETSEWVLAAAERLNRLRDTAAISIPFAVILPSAVLAAVAR